MAKKQRETAAPTPATPVVSRDSFQRLSYLYQASLALASILPSPTTSGRSGKHRSSKIKAAEGFVGGESGQGGKTTAASEDRGEGTSKLVEDEAARPKKRRRQQPKETSEALRPLSRHLAKEMIEVSKKATVRMDPSVKRTKCKGCGAVLMAGATSRVRIKPSGPHGHLIVSTCIACHTQRLLPAPPLLPPAPPPPSVDDPALPVDDSAVLPIEKRTKREKREKRQARLPVFFEREGHVSIRGNEVVVKDDYREVGCRR